MQTKPNLTNKTNQISQIRLTNSHTQQIQTKPNLTNLMVNKLSTNISGLLNGESYQAYLNFQSPKHLNSTQSLVKWFPSSAQALVWISNHRNTFFHLRLW